MFKRTMKLLCVGVAFIMYLFIIYPFTGEAATLSVTLPSPIMVSGTDYIVTFLESDTLGENTFNNINPGITFQGFLADDAIVAAQAIQAVLPASFDYTPASESDNFNIPYNYADPVVAFLYSNRDSVGGSMLNNANVDPIYGGSWASFQVVPIPGAVWLLGSGLIGIVGIRRKIKN